MRVFIHAYSFLYALCITTLLALADPHKARLDIWLLVVLPKLLSFVSNPSEYTVFFKSFEWNQVVKLWPCMANYSGKSKMSILIDILLPFQRLGHDFGSCRFTDTLLAAYCLCFLHCNHFWKMWLILDCWLGEWEQRRDLVFDAILKSFSSLGPLWPFSIVDLSIAGLITCSVSTPLQQPLRRALRFWGLQENFIRHNVREIQHYTTGSAKCAWADCSAPPWHCTYSKTTQRRLWNKFMETRRSSVHLYEDLNHIFFL